MWVRAITVAADKVVGAGDGRSLFILDVCSAEAHGTDAAVG
jgi:hypothetical protein